MSTFVQYAGSDGVGGLFQVPFPYLLQEHVQVKVNGFPFVQGTHYSFESPTSIRFWPWAVPAPTTVVEIRRVSSPDAKLANFYNGAVLTADDLNVATRQNFYLIQELRDKYEAMLDSSAFRLSNGNFTNAQELIDNAVQEVLQSDLLALLQSRISDIDSNAESIMEQASRLATIQSTIDTLLEIDGVGIATYVQNQVETLTTSDEALAARVALLGAEATGGGAFILDLDTVHVGPTESLAGRLTTISASLDGNTAAIQSVQSVVSGPGGLAAQYVVKTDVNGHVAGFGLYNSGSTSDFQILANRFAIVDPAAPANVKVPFVVSGGVVYMQNVVIADGLIENLTVGKLTSGVLTATITQNADINVGTGRIIWNNGSYMKVVGVGFGTANQFIEWYGPSMAITSCSESNAIQYLKTNGQAYFGGALLAGKLANSTQATVLATTNVATLGPFASNGNTITITFSWDWAGRTSFPGTSTGLSNYNATSKFNPSGTAVLARSFAGGGYVDVATLNVSGFWSGVAPTPIDNAPGSYNQQMAGSSTWVDNSGTTSTRAFQLRITALNHNIATWIKNVLSIQSVE